MGEWNQAATLPRGESRFDMTVFKMNSTPPTGEEKRAARTSWTQWYQRKIPLDLYATFGAGKDD